MRFEPRARRRGEQHRATRTARNRGSRGDVLGEGGPGLERVARRALVEAPAVGVVNGDAPRDQELQSAWGLAAHGEAISGAVGARLEPGREQLEQLLEADLLLEMALQLGGGPVEQAHVTERRIGGLRDHPGDEQVLAALEPMVEIGLEVQPIAHVLGEVGAQAPRKLRGRGAHYHLRAGGVRRAHELAQQVHRGEIAARHPGEVEQDARRTLGRALQALHQRMGAAEEDVAAQPKGAKPRAVVGEDGAIGHRSHPGAAPFAPGERFGHHVDAAQAHGEERERGEHPHRNADDEAESRNGDANEHDQCVVRTVQARAHTDEPHVEQVKRDVEQQPADDRHREELEDCAAEEQREREHQGDDDAGPGRVGAEHAARQGENEGLAPRGAAARARAEPREACGAKLVVEVDIDAGRHLQAVDVDEQAKECHQRHGDQPRRLGCDHAPVDVAQVARSEGGPQAARRQAREQQTLRFGLCERNVRARRARDGRARRRAPH